MRHAAIEGSHDRNVTPYRFIVLSTSAKVFDVALDAGFGDVSNFNYAFRAEFGVSPRLYRERQRTK